MSGVTWQLGMYEEVGLTLLALDVLLFHCLNVRHMCLCFALLFMVFLSIACLSNLRFIAREACGLKHDVTILFNVTCCPWAV